MAGVGAGNGKYVLVYGSGTSQYNQQSTQYTFGIDNGSSYNEPLKIEHSKITTGASLAPTAAQSIGETGNGYRYLYLFDGGANTYRLSVSGGTLVITLAN